MFRIRKRPEDLEFKGIAIDFMAYDIPDKTDIRDLENIIRESLIKTYHNMNNSDKENFIIPDKMKITYIKGTSYSGNYDCFRLVLEESNSYKEILELSHKEEIEKYNTWMEDNKDKVKKELNRRSKASNKKRIKKRDFIQREIDRLNKELNKI